MVAAFASGHAAIGSSANCKKVGGQWWWRVGSDRASASTDL